MAIKEMEHSKFSKIEISNTFDFKIMQSNDFSVKLDTDEGFMKNVDIHQDGDKLKVHHSHHISWMFRHTRPRITITMPVIKELRLTGAVQGEVIGFKSKEDFSLEMDGASRVLIDLQAVKTDIRVRGACTVEAKGSAQNLIVDVNGACTLELEDFAVKEAAIRLNGASNCKAQVNGRLDARLGGVSNLGLKGEPTIGDIRTTGMAKLSKIT
ncbi:MAG: DUF2807 domain-containing protein [Dehalococcoidales bacterium]|nr:DUF2807 domain-containing protein [Dehalococcoidales bacterium]